MTVTIQHTCLNNDRKRVHYYGSNASVKTLRCYSTAKIKSRILNHRKGMTSISNDDATEDTPVCLTKARLFASGSSQPRPDLQLIANHLNMLNSIFQVNIPTLNKAK